MGALLKEHGFDAIDPATRSEAAWLVANLQEVIEWRDSLPEYRRIALNSPGHVKREFLASQKGSVRPPGPRRLRRSIDMLAEGGEAMPGQDAATIEQAVLAVWQARGLRIPRSIVRIAHLLPVVSLRGGRWRPTVAMSRGLCPPFMSAYNPSDELLASCSLSMNCTPNIKPLQKRIKEANPMYRATSPPLRSTSAAQRR